MRRARDAGTVLVVSTTWPPMAAGAGRLVAACVGDTPDVEVVAPVGADAVTGRGAVTILPWLRFCRGAGGFLKWRTFMHHAEAICAPLWWMLRRRRRPGLIVCSITLFAGVGGYLAHRALGCPYVVFAHGEELAGPLRSAPGGWRHRVSARVLHAAAGVVCNSRFTQGVVTSGYSVPASRTIVLTPSVELAEMDVDAAEVAVSDGELPGGHVLLSVGRLAQTRKGYDRLIQAFGLLAPARRDLHLVIVGPGDQSGLSRLARECGVADRVRFVGEVSREALRRWFRAADVFVMPTRVMPDGDCEGFGIVFLEAGACGTPVVGGRGGGVDEAIVEGETGLLVNGDDPHEIAAAVARLIDDGELAERMGRAGQARVAREFTSAERRRAFAAFVERVASSGAPQ